jgi:hypothetical protein
MTRLKISRWVYFIGVTSLGIGAGVAGSTGDGSGASISFALGSLLMAVLTYPAGIVGTLCCFVLIYHGLATQAEVLALFAPVYAMAGVIQWYVVFPKIFSRPRSGAEQLGTPNEDVHSLYEPNRGTFSRLVAG